MTQDFPTANIMELGQLCPPKPFGVNSRTGLSALACFEMWDKPSVFAHNFNSEGIASSSPGLRGTSYPGKREFAETSTLKGLRLQVRHMDTTPLGLVASRAATLGLGPESLWDLRFS